MPKTSGKKKAPGKRGRAQKARGTEEQEPVSNYRREPKDDEPIGARTGEQISIPGVESELIPPVERRAKAHAVNTDKHKVTKALFDDSKAALIEEMLAHNIRDYDRHGVHVHINEKLDVKVEIE